MQKRTEQDPTKDLYGSKQDRGAPKRRKRRTTEEIVTRLLAAAEEEFKRNGFSGTTTAAIARRAEVTEAQLFFHFDSKIDIYREAILGTLSSHLDAFIDRHMVGTYEVDNMRESVERYVAELRGFVSEHFLSFMSLIVASAYEPQAIKGIEALDSLETYFKRGADRMRERLSEDAKIPPELMVRMTFATVLANVMFKSWLFPSDLASDEQTDQAIVDFVLDGLNANKDLGLDVQKQE